MMGQLPSELAVITTHGPATILLGAALLALAYLNWRYIETVTRFLFGDRVAKRLARSPFGNKIGGTVFLVFVGVLALVSGIVESVR